MYHGDPSKKYCPICQTVIEGELLVDGSYLFVHDNPADHSDTDIEALANHIQ